MAVDQAIGPVRIQFQDPVANNLHRHACHRYGFGARGPVIRSREGHRSPGLPCMLAATLRRPGAVYLSVSGMRMATSSMLAPSNQITAAPGKPYESRRTGAGTRDA